MDIFKKKDVFETKSTRNIYKTYAKIEIYNKNELLKRHSTTRFLTIHIN